MDFKNKNQYRKWKTKLNKDIENHLERNELNLDDVYKLNQMNHIILDEDNMVIENNYDDLIDDDNDNFLIDDIDLIQEESSKDSIDEIITKRILSIYVKSRVSNEQMNEILGLLNLVNDFYVNDKQIGIKSKLKIPKNMYYLKKENKLDIPKMIGFTTSCCNNKQVSLDSQPIYCLNCNKLIKKSEILKLKNCYLFYDLKKFIELILNNFNLKCIELSNDNLIRSFYDAKIYQNFLGLSNGVQILSMVFNSDGVPIFNSNSNQLWPLYLRLNEIDGKQTENKFLIGCYLTTSNKPDPNFFLEYIVNQLNELYVDGVYSSKLEKILRPVLFNFILDLPARSLFLNHNYYNGEFGCTDCYDSGERIKAKGIF